jgi:outer membrane immunogenic protein
MKRTRVLAALLFALFAVGGQAFAADVAPAPSPPPPPIYKSPPPIYDWTGFYIGVNAGYGSGTSNWSDGPVGSTGTFPIYGFLLGGTAGANYQLGEYVFGIEGDGDWTNLNGNSGLTCGAISAVVPPPDACQTQSRWLATLRGRVGYALDRVLFYGTAGAAFGNVQTGLNPPATFDSAIEAGWTVGGGVEFAITPNWTAKVEYLFVNLGNGACTTVGNCGGAAGSVVSFNENIVRAGVNFKFGPW